MAHYWKNNKWVIGLDPVLEPALADLRRNIEQLDLKLASEHYKSARDADPHYAPYLEKLNVHTLPVLENLRIAVSDKLMALQNEVQRQAIRDFAAGKYKDITEVPLYRTPEGQVTNIPDHMFAWYEFIAWLNELAVRWDTSIS